MSCCSPTPLAAAAAAAASLTLHLLPLLPRPASEALLVWGWRVPFLLATTTLIAAIALRYNMPESQEVRLNDAQRFGTVQ